MKKERTDDWLMLSDGSKFWPIDPNKEDVNIKVIASGLSRTCRFAGHIRDDVEFYSVAQHSVIVSQQVSKENALIGLIHDAVEGIGFCDIPTPLKPYLTNYKHLEYGCYKVIAAKFGLPSEIPNEVKVVDVKVLLTEKRDLLAKCEDLWAQEKTHTPYEHFKITDCWLPFRAKKEFLKRFYELTNHNHNITL